MTYEFRGDFKEVKPYYKPCAFCQLMLQYLASDTLEEQDKAVFKLHLQKDHALMPEISVCSP